MIRFYFLFSILLMDLSLQSQPTLMKEGQDAFLVTSKGDSLWGKAELNLEKELVQIKTQQLFRAIDFQKIQSLYLYNETEGYTTSYQNYPWDPFRSVLLEQVKTGSIHLLRKNTPRKYSNYIGSYVLNNSKEVMEREYFLWTRGSYLTKVKSFKKQFLSLLTEEEKARLTIFKKKNKLNFHLEKDQIILVSFLNNLRDRNSIVYNQ